jgi:phosphopantetheinyl transferase (holo-ACP synthase)
VYLSGRTADWAAKRGVTHIELSMTHSRELAAAVALGL